METGIAITLLIILVLLLIAIRIYNIANPKIQAPLSKKDKYKKKYHNPQNNYFKNHPDHTDVTHEYIESIWDEIKNK